MVGWPVLGLSARSLARRPRCMMGVLMELPCPCRHRSGGKSKRRRPDDNSSKMSMAEAKRQFPHLTARQKRDLGPLVVSEEPKKKKTEEPSVTFDKNAVMVPDKKAAKSMVFRLGPSRDDRDSAAFKKQLAAVEHIADPEVREEAMSALEERQRQFDLMDPDGLYEKMELRAMFNQPEIPAKDGKRVLIIHPRIREDLRKKLRGTGEQRRNIAEWDLREACSLVDTMGTHYAGGRYILPVRDLNPKSFFSERNLQEIDYIRDMECYDEIMINYSQLRVRQSLHLTSKWKCKVWDRFTTVLHIFATHASTSIAKLQVELAALEHREAVRRQSLDKSALNNDRLQKMPDSEMHVQRAKNEMQRLTAHAKSRLEAAQKAARAPREARKRSSVPSVALVGYTNSGKTTLLSALCPRSGVQGKKEMFATLDTTTHKLELRSGLKAVLNDTIGFISDLPPKLFAAFASTLEDAVEADVVLHVRDTSHPNTEAHRVNVMRVLRDIGFSDERLSAIIEVRNKIDLVKKDTAWEQSLLPGQFIHGMPEVSASLEISATKGTGIEELKTAIDERIRFSAGRHTLTLTLPTNGDHLEWLKKHGDLGNIETSNDGALMYVTMHMITNNIRKFHHKFPEIKLDRHLLPVKEEMGEPLD